MTKNNEEKQNKIYCKNCSSKLIGKFCHNCGQEKKDIHLSFRRLLHDTLGDIFSFDSRLILTIKSLFLNPGIITKEYLKGKRVKYIPPMKLYIFVSFIYFFLASLNGTIGNTIKYNNKNNNKQSQTASSKVEKNNENLSINNALNEFKSDNSFSGKIAKRFLNKAKKAVSNKKKFGDYLSSNFPKMMFILLPLFALIMKIFFRKANYFYIEHLVFSLHIHTFIFILLGIQEALIFLTLPISKTISNTTDVISNLWLIDFIFKSLKVFYGFSWVSTIFRGIISFFIYLILFAISFFIVLALTLLLF